MYKKVLFLSQVYSFSLTKVSFSRIQQNKKTRKENQEKQMNYPVL